MFIDEDNEIVVVSFIENGVSNPDGRPVAYGKGIEYKIQKKTNIVVQTTDTFDK